MNKLNGFMEHMTDNTPEGGDYTGAAWEPGKATLRAA